MYRKQVRRRRAVLVLLVIVSLVLLSSHFSEGSSGPLHGIQRGLATILAPIEEGADRALKPARDLVNWFDETFEARGR
jgi:rod shape-determining protein MreC